MVIVETSNSGAFVITSISRASRNEERFVARYVFISGWKTVQFKIYM